MRPVVYTAVVLAAAALLFFFVLPRASDDGGAAARFVPDATCIECHQQQHLEWTGSHHDLAMQPATEETVLGDFTTAPFSRKDGGFHVRTEGPDGKPADFEVKYTFGVEPLQQYLIELDGGRLQALTIAWDTAKKRWFHLYEEPLAHDDPLHWTGPNFTWNYMCAECHSTNLQKNYDLESNTYATTWSEIDVGCQGCHGPGSRHVEDPTQPLEVRLKGKEQVDACARCHSRRAVVDGDYRYGAPFLDHYAPRLLEDGLYFADGQILDEVYVYGSFLQTKKHRHGVRCTDCHAAHTARLIVEGNALCGRCHQEEPPAQFETLKRKVYDSKTHHFHEPGTPGSQCVDCHMPARNYMVVDPRRDHGFRVPRPDLTRMLGTPNACNGCHDDKTPQWAVEAVERWYPKSEHRGPHFAEAFQGARAGEADALPRLTALVRDQEQAGIVRATALQLLERFGRDPRSLLVATAAVQDGDALVRAAAVGVLQLAPPEQRGPWLRPLLEDPVRLVRTEAARALSDVPEMRTSPAFRAALEEYEKRQRDVGDRPEAHLNLGVLQTNLGRRDRAEEEYETALRLDPGFLPARFNLANLLNAQGRNDEAERQLREVLREVPGNGEAHYSLGLLLAERNRLADAVDSLAEAVRLLPDRARVRYNYALALQQLGRLGQAEEALRAAHETDARDPDIVYALVSYYVTHREWKKALPWAEKLVALVPRAPEPAQLLQRIRAVLR